MVNRLDYFVQITNGYNLIGENVRKERKKRGWTQFDLERELDLLGVEIPRSAISLIETRKRSVSDYELCALERVFHLPRGGLIDDQNAFIIELHKSC